MGTLSDLNKWNRSSIVFEVLHRGLISFGGGRGGVHVHHLPEGYTMFNNTARHKSEYVMYLDSYTELGSYFYSR